MFKYFLLILIISFNLCNLYETRQEKTHKSALLVGSVYCDTCSHHSFSTGSHFISGAVVAVECSGTSTTPNYKKEISTNEHGKFEVHLPFSVSKHVKKIKSCSVKLIKSSEPLCDVASLATSTTLNLKSRKEGKHIFSAGFFTFKPLKQPKLCDQNPSVQESKALESPNSILNPDDFGNLPPFENPPTSNPPPVVKGVPGLPQLPNLPPLPQLPPLPPLPGLPFLPPWSPRKASTTEVIMKTSQVSNQKVAQPQFFGPNPLRPPSLFPPIIPSPPTSITPPIIPSPPTSMFPPIVRSPSAPSLFPPLTFPPPVPSLLPLPVPSPQPPVSRFPLPRFPFQPVPGFPGGPRARESISSKHSSP